MPQEPTVKPAVSFLEGQNLSRYAKDAFGHHHPNYNPGKLAAAVCAANGWSAAGVRFYTGVTEAKHRRSGMVTGRVGCRQCITVTSRRLRHRIERITLQNGTRYQVPWS